jgi:hypothetical protein
MGKALPNLLHGRVLPALCQEDNSMRSCYTSKSLVRTEYRTYVRAKLESDFSKAAWVMRNEVGS